MTNKHFLVFYDSWLAKRILAKSYDTIMLFGAILTKLPVLSEVKMNHENIHRIQYAECVLLGFIISLLCKLFLGTCNAFCFIHPFLLFYEIYCIEYAIKFILVSLQDNKFNFDRAYRSVAFEQEAYECAPYPLAVDIRYAYCWVPKLFKLYKY